MSREPKRVNTKPFTVRAGGCDCECHRTCHTCGHPFVGNQPHINCGDMVDTNSRAWTKNWDYFGVGGYGANAFTS